MRTKISVIILCICMGFISGLPCNWLMGPAVLFVKEATKVVTDVIAFRFNALDFVGKGASHDFVSLCLGMPDSKDAAITLQRFPKDAAVADSNWLYEIEGICFIASFKNDSLLSVTQYSHDLYNNWQDFKIDSIANSCVGKSKHQIRNLFGSPKIESTIPFGYLFNSAKLSRNGEEVWSYNVSFSSGVMLNFKGNYCVKAGPHAYISLNKNVLLPCNT